MCSKILISEAFYHMLKLQHSRIARVNELKYYNYKFAITIMWTLNMKRSQCAHTVEMFPLNIYSNAYLNTNTSIISRPPSSSGSLYVFGIEMLQ